MSAEIKAELRKLEELRERFRPGGVVTEEDILAAFMLIHSETSVHSRGEGYGVIDNLCRCAIEIMVNGGVRLNEHSRDYIRQKMPLEPFVERWIASVKAVLNAANENEER